MMFRVWHAGGHYIKDGVSVEAATYEAAAALGAKALFDYADPIDRFDVFVCQAARPARKSKRFTILCDVTRVSFDQSLQAMAVQSVEFTPCAFPAPAASMQTEDGRSRSPL
jgi:hypothetical protein